MVLYRVDIGQDNVETPEDFIRAVLNGPLPDSPEYLARAERYEWGRLARRLRR
jgi:hypothetical protein